MMKPDNRYPQTRLTPGDRDERPEKILTEEDIISSVELMQKEIKTAMSDVIEELNRETKKRVKEQAAFMEKLQLEGIDKEQKYKLQRLQEYEKKRLQQSLATQKEINDGLMKELKMYGKAGKESAREAEKKKKESENLNKTLNEIVDLMNKSAEAAEKGNEKEAATLEKQADKLADQALKEDNKRKSLMDFKNNVKDQLGKTISSLANIGNKVSSEVNNVINVYAKYQSAINTRLQGTDKTFKEMEKTIRSNLGVSNPFVKTSEVMENLNMLVAQGIGTNLEQRAFLGSLSEKIATTFKINNETLLRLARLQRVDSTGLRMGMEASITNFLNAHFQNTEYLNNSYNTVASALLEATSQMGVNAAVSFESAVHKWLGSLSSVGMSDSAISNLASALGALSAGDTTSLQSNQFSSLLTLAASRSDQDYAELLIKNLDANKVNKLMTEAVGFLKDISMSNNQVLKSQYAQTFGLSLSDLTAIKNLNTDNIISDIKETNITPYIITNYLAQMVGSYSDRMSLAEQIKNVMSNITFSASAEIAQTDAGLISWEIAELLEKTMGGIKIPKITILGTGVDLGTVSGLMKTTIFGTSLLAQLRKGVIREIKGESGFDFNIEEIYGAFGGARPKAGTYTSGRYALNLEGEVVNEEGALDTGGIDSESSAEGIKEGLNIKDPKVDKALTGEAGETTSDIYTRAIYSILSSESVSGVFTPLSTSLNYIGRTLARMSGGEIEPINEVETLTNYQTSILGYLGGMDDKLLTIAKQYGHGIVIPNKPVEWVEATAIDTGGARYLDPETGKEMVKNPEYDRTINEINQAKAELENTTVNKQLVLLEEILNKLNNIYTEVSNPLPGLGG